MRRALAEWYDQAARDLPWRRTRDPYAITLSEFMLQQTQVVTVIPYYERWLKQFPDWHALAEANEAAVLKAWEGLGYYRRARNLQALARAVVARGKMPEEAEALLELPGIGPYTAAAIGSIAFSLPVAVLDGNVMRVLTRLLAIQEDIGLPATQKRLQVRASELLDAEHPARHNQAMMELGATICVPRQPLCLVCPVKTWCRGRTRAEEFPVKRRIAATLREETVAVLAQGDRLYCEQVPEGRPWAGLWRFPDFDPALMVEKEELKVIRYGITRYRVTMRAVRAEWKKRPRPGGTYLTAAEISERSFAAPHRKLAEVMKSFA